MLLAGDVGGTKTILAFFTYVDGRLNLIHESTFHSREHSGLEAVVAAFLSEKNLHADRACFGVAGPVRRGRIETPNLPWIIDAHQLEKDLSLPSVALINDLEANAHGVMALGPSDLVTLSAGAADAEGNRAVIAAGTGLGEAGMHWDGHQHRPFATEGGHTDFGPRTDLEAELLAHLEAQFGHVSYERVLSGPGLRNIYDFLRSTGRGEEPAWLTEEMLHKDPSAAISEAACAGRCPLCELALDMFVSIYGAEAGNLALKTMATGGLFVGGGIAPKIIEKLTGPAFMDAFVAKGRMKGLMQSIPVRVIMNDRAALLGAAICAARFMNPAAD
jgi:glucokinase